MMIVCKVHKAPPLAVGILHRTWFKDNDDNDCVQHKVHKVPISSGQVLTLPIVHRADEDGTGYQCYVALIMIIICNVHQVPINSSVGCK